MVKKDLPKGCHKREKKIVGLVEPVKIIGEKRTIETLALLDTGATRSSIDLKIAAKAGLGPIISVLRIKSQTEPRGYVRRAIVRGELVLAGIKKEVHFTVADRLGMRLPVLVGRDVLEKDFIVDVEKKPPRITKKSLKEYEQFRDNRSKS